MWDVTTLKKSILNHRVVEMDKLFILEQVMWELGCYHIEICMIESGKFSNFPKSFYSITGDSVRGVDLP